MTSASFWNRPTAELIQGLGSGTAGLATEEANRRLSIYGPNDAAAPKRRPPWQRFLVLFANPLVAILLFASALSAVTGDTASFVIVVTIVVLSVAMDFVQEMRAQNAVDALQAKVTLRARAVRDGQEVTVLVAELVPGDVVKLRAGDMVSADGRLLDARDFFVNEALLTGESYPTEKHVVEELKSVSAITTAEGVALAGTSVVSGTATLLVCATGRQTALGQLADTLIAKPPPTAFETGLRQFSELILRITALMVLFVLTEGLWFQRGWLESLLFALALVVGLTPELLPMIVTVTLGRGAVRMSQQRVIVKRLTAIHDLGAMDVLCMDKTGTLTEARMRLLRAVDAAGIESRRVFELARLNSQFQTGLKSPLDDAILEHDSVDTSAWRKLDEVPFDFERRCVSVLLDKDSERLLIVKGAPEGILRLCTSAEQPDRSTVALTDARRTELMASFERIGEEGCRALGVAYRLVALDHSTAVVTDETELVFAGFVVFLDPPKESAAAAITAMAQDGVAVKIITGDNERVATHLCGQLKVKVLGVVTGDDIAALSDEALLARVRMATLFCRITPPQKLRVLMTLKRAGQTVGFLGDGVNDAPALHAADVGISVDSATDVAKAAADIVLLERDLCVLHEGVVEGRRTVLNVGKYILMASSANLGNILSMVIAGLFLPFLPLLPIQVLLTNLIYDIAQVGLPFDRVDRDVVARPVHWDVRLIERFMLVIGPISTLFDVLTFGVLLLLFRATVPQFRTGWFIESLVTQILMIFSVRTRHHPFASRPHVAVTMLAIGTAALTLALPFLPVGIWFEFVAPTGPYYLFLALVVIGFLITVEAVKRLFYAHLAGQTWTNL